MCATEHKDSSMNIEEIQSLADQAMLKLTASTSPEVREKAWEELTRLRRERDKERARELRSDDVVGASDGDKCGQQVRILEIVGGSP